MMKKLINMLLCGMMVVTLSACGSAKEVNEVEENQVIEQENSVDSQEESDENATAQGNKKIVVVQEDDFDSRVKAQENILLALKQGGYEKGKNAEIIEINMKGEVSKSQEVIDQVKQVKPDVVLLNGANFVADIAKELEGTEIPVLINLNVSNFVDEQGIPKKNVSGLYSMPKDLQMNAFKLLNQISPANGKKAVFITSDGGFFTKEGVEQNLKTLNIELKDYCESKYVEDFQEAVNKYNNDDEVGWMLIGVWPTAKKDNTAFAMTETAKWDVDNRKKPTVTYWDVAVEMGLLAGLGVDLVEGGSQMGEMAVTLLNGEDIKNVKAQEPRKINIVLNKKRAEQLKITFPPEILGAASQVY